MPNITNYSPLIQSMFGGKRTSWGTESTLPGVFQFSQLNSSSIQSQLKAAGIDTSSKRCKAARLEEVQAAITEKHAQRKMMENFMEELRSLPEQVDYFDEAAWYAMVDFVTVYGKDDVRFNFKNGMEIPVKTK